MIVYHQVSREQGERDFPPIRVLLNQFKLFLGKDPIEG